MSDLLEDQKIHYIVKDYRRMFETYWALYDIAKGLREKLDKRESEIAILKSSIEDLKKSIPSKSADNRLKGVMNEIESQTNSLTHKLQQSIEQIAKISNNIETVRKSINV